MKPVHPISHLPIGDVLRKARLIVACGSGGVGKTTTSAALALQAAMAGRRVLVLTIDPAQRLLQAHRTCRTRRWKSCRVWPTNCRNRCRRAGRCTR